MFKITQCYDGYDNEHVKVHFASTKEIAEEVATELRQRFPGSFVIAEAEDNVCGWDPGGMLMTGDEVFSFLLDNITVECKAQHFDYFVGCIQNYQPRGDATKYFKIHGKWTCICVTPNEYSQLLKLAADPDFAARAALAWEKREQKLNALAQQGDIVRVIKGEDGKLYKMPEPGPVDKKMLN